MEIIAILKLKSERWAIDHSFNENEVGANCFIYMNIKGEAHES